MAIPRKLSAEGGNRTRTGCKPHRILSPARLPVPPLRPAYTIEDFKAQIKFLGGEERLSRMSDKGTQPMPLAAVPCAPPAKIAALGSRGVC